MEDLAVLDTILVMVVSYEFVQLTGLEKYLNFILPVGQLSLTFCLPGALPRLPKFSNSLIIHEWKSKYRRVLNLM